MKKLDFFFGLNLSQRISFSHTDNLSETLQKPGMSATSGQLNAKLTKDALKKIRNDDCFATFYQTVLRKKTASCFYYGAWGTKKQKSSWKIWGWNWNAFLTSKNLLWSTRSVIVSSIEERFDQPSFKAYSNMESLLIGVLSSQDVSSQMDYMKESHTDDVRTG